MIVNLGARPPCFLSSPSLSKSRGSKAILFPPSNAEPACAEEVTFIDPLADEGVVGPWPSSDVEVDAEPPAGTLRRESPPFEVISFQ